MNGSYSLSHSSAWHGYSATTRPMGYKRGWRSQRRWLLDQSTDAADLAAMCGAGSWQTDSMPHPHRVGWYAEHVANVCRGNQASPIPRPMSIMEIQDIQE